jgi:CBS domain-containing protein
MLRNVSLADIMSDHPITVKEDFSAGAVAHLLLRYRINGILVVSATDPKKVVGIFTTTDALRIIDAAFEGGAHKIEELERLAAIPVGEVATRDIVSLKKDTKLTKAIAVMHKKNVHTIPIYDGETLVGVVGRHDLLNAALSDH